MFLDLEELLIKPNEFRPLQLPLCSQLLLGVREDFLAVAEEIGRQG